MDGNLIISSKCTEHRTKRRSRYGCRNCKLRKLKCDETKPQCKRCSSFGILCNFEQNIPDLQPVAESLAIQERVELQPPPSSAIWTSDGSTSYQLDAKCQEFVMRYLGRGLITPHDPNMVEANRKLLILAFTQSPTPTTGTSTLQPPTPAETHHLYHATSLFSSRLQAPLKPLDKDPIWGTAAALALLTFSSPTTSWPLSPASPADFQWLRINKGKMSLWDVVNPLREDSLFVVMRGTYAVMNTRLPVRGIEGISRELAEVCGLDEESTREQSPYFDAAHAVSSLLGLRDDEVTVGHTEVFTRCIEGVFKGLLVGKDPVALLLSWLWYGKAGRGVWWIESRGRVEGAAICEYLRLWYGGYDGVLAFLPGGCLAGG